MVPITQAEYARSRAARGLHGGTKAAVLKAVRTGRVKLVNGMIHPEQADRDWAANTNAAQQRSAVGASSPLTDGTGSQLAVHVRLFAEAKVAYDKAPAMFVRDPESGKTIKNPYLGIMQEETAIISRLGGEGDTDYPGGETMSEAQTRKEIALADLREDEVEENQRELLRKKEVIRLVGDMVVTAKTNLRGIGAKLAADLCAENSAAVCQAMVDQEIDAALREISKWSPA